MKESLFWIFFIIFLITGIVLGDVAASLTGAAWWRWNRNYRIVRIRGYITTKITSPGNGATTSGDFVKITIISRSSYRLKRVWLKAIQDEVLPGMEQAQLDIPLNCSKDLRRCIGVWKVAGIKWRKWKLKAEAENYKGKKAKHEIKINIGPWCKDSDNGLDFSTRGFCEDNNPYSLDGWDKCSGGWIEEGQCNKEHKCVWVLQKCPKGKCVEGRCVQLNITILSPKKNEEFEKNDLLPIKIEAVSPDTIQNVTASIYSKNKVFYINLSCKKDTYQWYCWSSFDLSKIDKVDVWTLKSTVTSKGGIASDKREIKPLFIIK